jgi:aminoglycoside phosphotransferase (APT) family kinase protein
MFKPLKTQLAEYTASLFPASQNPQITELANLATGAHSEVYRFTLAYDEAGTSRAQQFVVKLYASTPDGMDRALKERHALFSLRGAHYPVPGVLAVEVEESPLERPFVIMEYIDGQRLDAALREADPAQRAELVGQFVNLMTDLHGRGTAVLTPRMQGLPSPNVLANREVYSLRQTVEGRLLGQYRPLIEWLYARRGSVPCSAPVVTHRDFVPSNVVLDPRGMPYVLDWAWQIGDPRYDLAWTLLTLERTGQAALAAQVLAEYERVTGGEVEGLGFYRVLVAARWLIETTVALRDHLSYGEHPQHAALMLAVLEPARAVLASVQAATGLALGAVEDVLS